MQNREQNDFWQELKTDRQESEHEQRSHLPAGAALTEPGFPGDAPEPGYTLPPTPLMVKSPADPEGSWTGVPEQRSERPVQDADDL